MNRLLFIAVFCIAIANTASAQHKASDKLNTTDRFGFTTMLNYNYKNWVVGDNKTAGNFNFDSFRIWAQTDVNKKFYGAVQFRFYQGWNTPTYAYVGMNINENNALELGQIWVPFGYGYQPFDDWGNISFYVGLQDDYDYGISWKGVFNSFIVHAAFFKNQQLSSSSPDRYDTDIFSGEVGDDYLFSVTKRNEEVNQINLRTEFVPEGDNWDMKIGLSGMYGQIYNYTTDEDGDRLAAAAHYGLNFNNFHFNAQYTWYKYSQILPDTATQDMKDFINVSSWAFAYEIPVESSIFTTSLAYNFIGEKLSAYGTYSYLWGGTSQSVSQLTTFGVRTLWDSFDVFAEVHYGVNDPQLSGNASGYGRDAHSYDLRVDIRLYYKLKIISKETIDRFLKKKE